MIFLQYTFWICLALIVYVYLLYPVVLFVSYAVAQIRRDWSYLHGRRNRRVAGADKQQLPTVSFVISAYNEESVLGKKLANLQALDYPLEKLEVIIVSDGSTDGTNQILRSAETSRFRVFVLEERRGKANALNHGCTRAHHEILIFSDASTLFAPDAVRHLVRHFAHPEVGVVCGSLQFEGTEESKQTDGVYWKYESMLRLMEARLGATLTASGAIYALRRSCYQLLPPGSIIEDFLVPMNARMQGYSVVYDPEAVATEFAAATVAGEFTRRVRLAVGSFYALRDLLRIPMHGFTMLAFVSHKLLRWLVPFFIIAMLISNTLLLDRSYYGVMLIGQAFFYLWASLGYLFRNQMQGVRFALVGYFLLAMNLAFLVGFCRYLAGRQEVTWQRVN
jgi:cellulose synthase/poly-beta-1,6-N-acetylglucosamine synthase-like glycosyltransferase